MVGYKLSIEADFQGRAVWETEDNSYTAYYVVATDFDGFRMAHFKKFDTRDGLTNKEAFIAAEKLRHKMELARVDGWEGPKLGEHWTKFPPVPGSYADQDEEFEASRRVLDCKGCEFCDGEGGDHSIPEGAWL